MKPTITPILLLAFALPLCAEEPRTVKLTLSPETTYLMEPQLPDGRIDYVAVLNKKLSVQTTPENNLLVGINSLVPSEKESPFFVRQLRQPDAETLKYREQFWKMIGLDAPPPMDSLVGITPTFYLYSEEEYEKALLEIYSKEEIESMLEKLQERDRNIRKSELDTGEITNEKYEEAIKRIEQDYPYYYREIINVQWWETLRRPWTAEEFPLIAKWLPATNELAKKLMDISQRRTGYYHPQISDSSLTYSVLLPYVQSLRDVARLFQMRGNFEFARGNFEQAIECAFSPIRMGRTVRTNSGTLAEEMVGVAMTGMGNHHLTIYLANLPKEIDASWILQRKKEHGAIVTKFGQLPSVPIWHLGERAGTLSFIQALAVEPKTAHEFVKTYYSSDREFIAKYEKLFTSDIDYDWDEVMRQVNLFYDDWEEVLLIPNWQRQLRAVARLDQRLAEYAKRSIDSDDTSERRATDFLLGYLAPGIEPAMIALTRSEWDSRATSVAFALAAYRADNGGESPDSLEQLIPKYLDKVPDSPFTDKPLRYIKRRNDVLIANDDTFKLDGSEEAVEKRIAEALPGARAYPHARSYVLVVSKK